MRRINNLVKKLRAGEIAIFKSTSEMNKVIEQLTEQEAKNLDFERNGAWIANYDKVESWER